MSKLSFGKAYAQYVHRFTMQHVPNWALVPHKGKYYAPHFATDKEWYDNTVFPPDPRCDHDHCYTSGQTWPLGHWLDAPFSG